jgi:hypothetical protein
VKRALLVLALLSLTVSVALAGNTLTNNQLVKQPWQYFVSDSAHTYWMHSCTCGANFGGASRSVNISPSSSDPRHSTLPASTVQQVPGHIGCGIFDSSGDGLPDFNFDFVTNSLEDMGTWTVTCSCLMVDPAYCVSDPSASCGIACDSAGIVSDPDPTTFVITVFNSPPTASITTTPSAPAWNSLVTLHSNANDPDHGTTGLSYHWNITAHPSGTALSSAAVANPTIQFTSDHDIGHWSFSLDVDDQEGERASTSRSFDVPNIPPTLSTNPVSSATINAMQSIAITATATDPDGGSPSIAWNIASSPPGASHGLQSNYATGNTFTPIVTGKNDIGVWHIEASATDNEGPMAHPSGLTTHDVTVNVMNLPPHINLTGSPSIRVGDTIHAATSIRTDDFGDDLNFRWEIVQVPHAAGIPLHTIVSTSSYIDIPTTAIDAGTWIFKLTATETGVPSSTMPSPVATTTFTVLVDGDPVANIALSASGPIISGDPPNIGSNSFPLTLDASGSIDPDSPCPTDPNHCHETATPPAIVSPGIVAYVWSLIDVSPELSTTYPLGRVDEVFGIDGTSPTLVLQAADLLPGQYTFQVEVKDDEGNTAVSQQSVVVVQINGAPTAIVSGPDRYVVSAGGLDRDIVISGHDSFDLDNILSGSGLSAGIGIIDYQWDVVAPPGCTPPAIPSGASADSFTLYSAGSTPLNGCLGTWTFGLTVGDDDTPQRRASATTHIVIGNCTGSLCIDSPTTAMPQIIDFSDQTDVTVYYHLDSTVYEDPAYTSGAFTRLDIFADSDPMPRTPFYTAFDPNALASDKGSILTFNWNGYGNDWSRPKSGTYSATVTIDSSALSIGSFSTSQPQSIHIAVADLTVLPTSNSYARFDDLDSGASQLHFNFRVAGGTSVDQLHWRVRDAADTVVFEADAPVVNAGTVTWDGKIAGVTLATGTYTFELEAIRAGASLGKSPRFSFTVYTLSVKPHVGTVPAEGVPVLVNDDDDDWNGASDLTQNPSAPGENDLVQVDFVLDPVMTGDVTISADAAPAPFTLWLTNAKGVPQALPMTIHTPVGVMPPTLFVEATSPGTAHLRIQFTPMGGAPLPQQDLKLNLVQTQIMLDTNNDHTISAGDLSTYWVRIARWDNAYGAAPSYAVANAADPANFIEQDPARFYVRVQDPAANTDPTVAEVIHVNLGTLDKMLVPNDALVDETLTETGVNTGVFTSRSQLLTTNDLPVNPDDGFAAHDGVAGVVADNANNDRTHKADIDGALQLSYQPAGAAAAMARNLPVCARAPESRFKVQMRVHAFNEPFQDIGYGIAQTGKGNHVFDFSDTNGNGRHDVGEPSEPYRDLSSGGMLYVRGDGLGVADGRGAVVNQAQVDQEIERANLAWAPACIRFEQLGALLVSDAPKIAGVDVLADGEIIFQGPGEEMSAIYAAYSAGMGVDVLEVFFAGPLNAANAIAFPPWNTLIVHGENSFIVIAPNLDISDRTLAHELGHVLTNQEDVVNPMPIFFPALYDFGDDHENSYRRFTAATEAAARTARPAGMPMATGNLLLKAP